MAGYGEFAEFYDRLTENIDYKKVSEYVCSLLAENGVKKGLLLDLACGTGQLSFYLEKAGYEVIGADASQDMLSIAQQKKLAIGSDVVFICQKMQELDLYGTVDAAVCMLDSINHLTSESDVWETLRLVSLFMNEGGVFVFDVNTPYKHRCVLGNNTFVYDLDDLYCVWLNSFDEKHCLTNIHLDIFERDEEDEAVFYKYSEEFSERGYELDEIRRHLEEVEFNVVGIYDEMSQNQITEESQRAVFVCVFTGRRRTQ